MKLKGLVLLISGTGGAGKNTIIQGMLSEEGYKFISSYTTRERRDVDTPNQYQYISKEEFEEKIKTNEIFEYDMFNNNYYGTSRKLFTDGLKEANVVLKDISVMGYKNIEDELGDQMNIMSVFLTETKSVLKNRLVNRGEAPEKIKNRLRLYKKEQAQIPNYHFVIRNNVYLNTLEKMMKLAEFGLGNATLVPTLDHTKVSAKKIDKLASKLEKGKHLKSIKVALHENQIYIVDGVHRYLASLKTGKNVVKQFVDELPLNLSANKEEWAKIFESYKA
ncbi:MAG: ParB N-terminal domain-containing protein [Clostridia bacterium]|nr:ParB N-terminal domain-containing protein [Clostridia bacterium]